MTRPTMLTIKLAQRNAARRPEPEKVSWLIDLATGAPLVGLFLAGLIW